MVGTRPADWIYIYSVIILGLIYYYFTYAIPDAGVRLFTVSIFRVLYFTGAAWALYSSSEYRRFFGSKALIGLLLAGACWYLFRGCISISSDDLAALFRTGYMQSVNFLIASIGNILITLALSRLEAENALRAATSIAAELQAQSEGLEATVQERTQSLEREVADRKLAEIAVMNERDRAESALTDLLSTQNHLVQAEKMAALGRLVAGAAHELNTPLGVSVTVASHISDSAKVLETAFASGGLKRRDVAKYLTEVSESCDLLSTNLLRAAELVQSLRQVAADQASDERRHFELGKCLLDTITSLAPVWRKPGHRVDVVCSTPIELYSHPGVISQIVTNLVTNSVVHGFEPNQAGYLRIEATLSASDFIEIRYTDNGKGIAREARGMVFEPFFTTRRNSGSTGLGLHIIYNLVVSKLCGCIDLDSQDGIGVCFVIRFPISSNKDV